MFCPECGTDCGGAKFCSNCGTKLRKNTEGIQTVEQKTWEVPAGVYEGFRGHIVLGPTWLEIHNKKMQSPARIPYNQLTGVSYGRNHGLKGGFASIRWEGNCYLPIPKVFGEALRDATSIQTVSLKDLLFYHICCFLYTFVDPASGGAPVYARESEDSALSPARDLLPYYETYNPYRADAAEALREDTGMSRKEAERQIDAYFDRRQQAEYAADPTAALRDLNKILRTPKDERREQLEAANQAFCPRCLSTSISTQKRGFSGTMGFVGNRIVPVWGTLWGFIGANSTMAVCMKCGYKWTPRYEK